MMKHPKWKWSCLGWTHVGAVPWQGGEHTEHGKEGQEMWRGGEGGSQPPEIRKVPVHSFPPEALPKQQNLILLCGEPGAAKLHLSFAASHGMDLSTFTASLSITLGPPAPLGSLFGWQLPFPSSV